MDWAQLVGICLGTSVILAAMYAVGKLVRDLMSGMRRLGRMLDDWLGEPEQQGIPGSGRPGVIARLASVEDNVNGMKLQLTAVPRLERRVAEMEAQLKVVAERDHPTGESAFLNSQVERAVDPGPAAGYGF